jgi:hypothetical protein
MTSKKYLSRKKTSQQCISISPALKDWIQRYVSKKRKENPEDNRYKSISAFYTSVMENVLNAFEEGKTLEDFDRFVDQEVYSFYDEFSFKALIPLYEMVVETNKYTKIDYERTIHFFSQMHDFFKRFLKKRDINKIETFLKRIKNYFNQNKICSYLNFELITHEDSTYPRFRIEAVSIYKNIIYENIKFFSAIFGLLGIKIEEFIYSEKDSYYRIDAQATDLFFENKFLKRKFMTLLEHNLNYFTQYQRLLKDEDYYLWMKMAEDKDVIIDFADDFSKQRWLERIQKDIEHYGQKGDQILTLLYFFERLHWIDIENENPIIFRIRLPQNNKEQRAFLLDYFSKITEIKEHNGKFYL